MVRLASDRLLAERATDGHDLVGTLGEVKDVAEVAQQMDGWGWKA